MKYKHSGFKIKSSGFSPAVIRLGLLYALLFIALLFSQSRWLLGDVNNDGSVDVTDIVRTVNIILGIDPPPESQELIMADVNDDGDVNIMDIIVMLNYILDTLCSEDSASPCAMNYAQCCPDTTGNNFVWDIQVFGNESWSINMLYDAFIIDEDDIWAVGEIREFDGDTLHNYLHWDGEEWTRGIIYEVNNSSQLPHLFFSIYGFTHDDLWVSATLPSYYDGNIWYKYMPADDGFPTNLGGIMHIWGTSSSNMYFSEHSGDIIHWDGETFTIMETTTGSGSQYNSQYPIQDLYGIDENHIWTLAGDPNLLTEDYPLKLSFYDGEEWTDQYIITSALQEDNQLGGRIYGIWAYGDTSYASAALNGLWHESISNGEGSYFPLDSLDTENAAYARGRGIDGNNYNDIFTVSIFAKFAHYNGATWFFGNEIYSFLEENYINYGCTGLDVNGNTILLYGYINVGEKVWVARGVRME